MEINKNINSFDENVIFDPLLKKSIKKTTDSIELIWESVSA